MKIHPAADWLPELNGSEFEELKQDIAKRGLREPILVKSGHIVDGRHRYKACIELDIEPRVEEYEGDDLIQEIFSRNILRRHLTPQQRADLAVKMCGDQLVKEAQERSAANLKKGDQTPDGLKSAHRETRGRTAERIAKIARVGRDVAREALRRHKGEPAKLKKKPQIDAAVVRIEKVCGKEFANAVRNKARLKNPQDVLAFADQTDNEMRKQQGLIETGWRFQKARLFKSKKITLRHTLQDLAYNAASEGGSLSIDVDGWRFAVTRTKSAA